MENVAVIMSSDEWKEEKKKKKAKTRHRGKKNKTEG